MTISQLLYLFTIYFTDLFVIAVLLLPLFFFLGFIFYAFTGFIFSFIKKK